MQCTASGLARFRALGERSGEHRRLITFAAADTGHGFSAVRASNWTRLTCMAPGVTFRRFRTNPSRTRDDRQAPRAAPTAAGRTWLRRARFRPQPPHTPVPPASATIAARAARAGYRQASPGQPRPADRTRRPNRLTGPVVSRSAEGSSSSRVSNMKVAKSVANLGSEPTRSLSIPRRARDSLTSRFTAASGGRHPRQPRAS